MKELLLQVQQKALAEKRPKKLTGDAEVSLETTVAAAVQGGGRVTVEVGYSRSFSSSLENRPSSRMFLSTLEKPWRRD